MGVAFRVLEDEVTREEFAEVATGLGLNREHVFTPQDDGGHEESWVNQDRTGVVHYVEDPFSNLTYITAGGAAAETLIETFTRKIPLYWPESLIEIAHMNELEHNERVRTLFRLAVTFPDYDPQVGEIFEGYALSAPSPLLRGAALDAIGLRAWEELRPVVERVARDDLDPTTREHARAVLDRWIAARGE